MTQRFLPFRKGIFFAAALACFGVGPAAAASFCETGDDMLIWASCRGDAPTVALVLLPEDAGVTPPGALDVTGGYTAEDRRSGDRPKPVGLFVRAGDVVSREYVRFDGVLAIDEAGAPTISHRRRAKVGGEVFDLEDPVRRAAFLAAAANADASVLQTHLLIADGEVDAHPVDGAPRFRRRVLFQAQDGSYGLYDSSPEALTLAEAAQDVARRFAPAMALNLDMGSYDFCSRGEDRCGALSFGQTGKLSNLLRFRGGG